MISRIIKCVLRCMKSTLLLEINLIKHTLGFNYKWDLPWAKIVVNFLAANTCTLDQMRSKYASESFCGIYHGSRNECTSFLTVFFVQGSGTSWKKKKSYQFLTIGFQSGVVKTWLAMTAQRESYKTYFSMVLFFSLSVCSHLRNRRGYNLIYLCLAKTQTRWGRSYFTFLYFLYIFFFVCF